MRNLAAWGVLGLSLLLLGCLAMAHTVPILETEPPTLDGQLAAGEWESALRMDVGEEAEAYVGRWNGALYVALRGPAMLIGSLLIQSDDRVRVLHASAALGTGIYERDGDVWVLREGFSWQCRMTGFSEPAVTQRDEFLERSGWLATISRLGPMNEMEYRIEEVHAPMRILILAMTLTDGNPILSWPVPPGTAEAHRTIITGPLPEYTSFDLEAWLDLETPPDSGS